MVKCKNREHLSRSRSVSFSDFVQVFTFSILQVHADAVEAYAHKTNTFDQVPDSVVVSLLHHKAREVAMDADAYAKILCPWFPVTQQGQDSTEAAGLKLSDPTLHALQKPISHKLKISERLINERIVHLIRAGSDGQKEMLGFLQCLVIFVLESSLPQDLPAQESSSIQRFRNELKEIVDGIRCINGALAPGEVDSSVVKRLMNNAKANNLGMSGIVVAAMQASNLWQDFLGMVFACGCLLGKLTSHNI